MRFLLVLAALVGAALAFPPVPGLRADCPPAGYTAISGSWKSLDLPPYGKYAICLTTIEESAEQSGLLFNFTWNGVFRLTKSVLLLDRRVRLHAKYPSKLEFNDVTLTGFSTTQNAIDSGLWGGIKIEGSPNDIPAMYSKYQKDKKFGKCGTLNKVTIDKVTGETHPLDIINCTSAKLNEISIVQTGLEGDSDCVEIEDSKNLIFTDLSVVCDASSDAVSIDNSEAAFVRPFIYAGDDAFDLEDGTNVTVCDGFVSASDFHYILGDDSGAPVSAAVAGRTNTAFPDQISFEDQGGILFTLKSCPEKFSSSYPMKMWKQWFTNND